MWHHNTNSCPGESPQTWKDKSMVGHVRPVGVSHGRDAGTRSPAHRRWHARQLGAPRTALRRSRRRTTLIGRERQVAGRLTGLTGLRRTLPLSPALLRDRGEGRVGGGARATCGHRGSKHYHGRPPAGPPPPPPPAETGEGGRHWVRPPDYSKHTRPKTYELRPRVTGIVGNAIVFGVMKFNGMLRWGDGGIPRVQ